MAFSLVDFSNICTLLFDTVFHTFSSPIAFTPFHLYLLRIATLAVFNQCFPSSPIQTLSFGPSLASSVFLVIMVFFLSLSVKQPHLYY